MSRDHTTALQPGNRERLPLKKKKKKKNGENGWLLEWEENMSIYLEYLVASLPPILSLLLRYLIMQEES